MEPKAEAGCVLKVDVQCVKCKMKLMEVLSSISGVYSVTIDAEQGIAKVVGEVEPNALLRALSRSGKHAELVRVTFRYPRMNRDYNYERYASPPPYDQRYGYNNYYNYGYNAIGDSYHRELPEHSPSHESRQYYDYRDANYSGGYMPPARFVPPSYPAQVDDEYEEAASISLCAIM